MTINRTAFKKLSKKADEKEVLDDVPKTKGLLMYLLENDTIKLPRLLWIGNGYLIVRGIVAIIA